MPSSPGNTARGSSPGTLSYVDGVLTDGATLKLCRLRYVGSAHNWRFAIYRAGHDDYDESIFPTGLSIGTCEDALDTACDHYLGDRLACLVPLGCCGPGPGGCCCGTDVSGDAVVGPSEVVGQLGAGRRPGRGR